MKVLNFLNKKDGIASKVTAIVDKSITDKDKKAELVYNILTLIMQSEVAKWVRAMLAILIVVACLFFGNEVTLEADKQFILLSSVTGFYFLDYFKSFFGKK